MRNLISKANEEVYKAVMQSKHPLKSKIELAYIQEDNDKINRILLSLGVNSSNKDIFCRNVDKFILNK